MKKRNDQFMHHTALACLLLVALPTPLSIVSITSLYLQFKHCTKLQVYSLVLLYLKYLQKVIELAVINFLFISILHITQCLLYNLFGATQYAGLSVVII